MSAVHLFGRTARRGGHASPRAVSAMASSVLGAEEDRAQRSASHAPTGDAHRTDYTSTQSSAAARPQPAALRGAKLLGVEGWQVGARQPFGIGDVEFVQQLDGVSEIGVVSADRGAGVERDRREQLGAVGLV